MGRLVLILGFLMCGCATLNSSRTENASTNTMGKACGCGKEMGPCGRNADGSLCCKPEDCRCGSVAGR